MDRLAPSLPEALDQCQADAKIVVVPMMVPDEPALRRWLNKVLMRWRAAQPHARQIRVGTSLVTHSDLSALLAASFEDLAEHGTDLSLDDWERDPLAWSHVPEHRGIALLCTGPRCAAKGALSLWPQLTQVIAKHPQLRKQLLVMQTTCQTPCNQAPVLSVQPDGTWYGQVRAEQLCELLEAHLGKQAPTPEGAFHRQKLLDSPGVRAAHRPASPDQR